MDITIEEAKARLEVLRAKGWNKCTQEERLEWSSLKKFVENPPTETFVEPEEKIEEEAVSEEPKKEESKKDEIDKQWALKEMAACLYGITAIMARHLAIHAGNAGMNDAQRKELVSRIENLNNKLNG